MTPKPRPGPHPASVTITCTDLRTDGGVKVSVLGRVLVRKGPPG